ncbi:MAG: putative toxin-antitoxin system toxin component, PIN family [Candidatus Aminicenantes bacterium]
MRVVLDTNIFISSFFGGKPKQIIDLWKNGKILLCLSDSILDEYIRVLQKLSLQNEPEMEELLGLFAKGIHILFTKKTPDLNLIAEDPDDDKFIECAVALKARYIVSRDKALLAYGDYMSVRILSAHEFLEIIRIKA